MCGIFVVHAAETKLEQLRRGLPKTGPLRLGWENQFLNFAHEYILVQK